MGGRKCPVQVTRRLQSIPLNFRWALAKLEDKEERHDFQFRADASQQAQRDQKVQG